MCLIFTSDNNKDMKDFKANKFNEGAAEDLAIRLTAFYTENLPAKYTVKNVNVCTTNGMSAYVTIGFEGLDKNVIVRHSDHKSSLGYGTFHGQLAIEIGCSLSPSINCANEVQVACGTMTSEVVGYNFMPHTYEIQPSQRVESDKIVGERITSKGTTLLRKEVMKPTKFKMVYTAK